MRTTFFDGVPRRRIPRSRKDLSHDHKTSMSVGTIYPILCEDVLPDDVFSVVVKQASRVSTTFVKPIMDNLACELHAFFVPLSLVYDDAHKVFGNPSPNAYTTTDRASIPFYSDIEQDNNSQNITVSLNTVNERLGLPIGTYRGDIDVLEPRAFACIYEEYFRDENVQSPMLIHKGQAMPSELPNNLPWSPSNYNGQLPHVTKLRDYFTSCVPKPQKGDPVSVPINFENSTNGDIIRKQSYSDNPNDFDLYKLGIDSPYGGAFLGGEITPGAPGTYPNSMATLYPSLTSQFFEGGQYVAGLNLSRFGVDLSKVEFANIAVEDIRLASALQRMLEVDASYGSHYHDYLIGHFDCFIRDDVVQRPEYLGGGLIPITIQQVNQTSAGTTTDPLGSVAGTSLTNGYFKFNRKFKQHGKLFVVAFIRQYHSYSQGIPKRRMRRTREEFFDPLLSHLGEQPVYRSEIFVEPGVDLKENVFGYNVAHADYQFAHNRITGQMRSGVENSFDLWHLGDYYSNAPALTDDFVEETAVNVDRVLSAESSVVDNFLAEFYFNISAVRKMPHFTTPKNFGV